VQLAVALRAVCDNALQAAGPGGSVSVAARWALPDDAPESAVHAWAEIVVSDSGPGISPEVRRHLFDPFYCGRQAGRGLGMGLAKCWRIVTRHGGQVSVSGEPGEGARFVIRLPGARGREE
jgi:hypothetical protein